MSLILNDDAQKYLDDVKAAAKARGCLDKLERQLEYLSTYGCSDDPEYSRCSMMKDLGGSMSFCFTMLKKSKDIKGTWEYWFSGAMIFYAGAGKPGVPEQFSVSLDTTNEDRWEVHT